MSDTVRSEPATLDGLQRQALIAGGVGALLLIVGAIFSVEQFFRSYLLGFLFWTAIGVGGLGLALLHQLTGGAWGMVTRRMLEAAARTLPFMALLFIPLVFGMHSIYEWTHAEEVANDALLQHKAGWLNEPFFFLRTGIYFAVWSLFALLLGRWAAQIDTMTDPAEERRIRSMSAVGLLFVVITVTFAGFDWVMSLDPHWFSSIFGAIIGVGAILSALALTVVVLALLREREPFASVVSPAIFNDLGSLMLAFTMIWAYLNLSQYLIIWSANLPEEVTWYIERSEHGWNLLAIALVVFGFAVPFVLLLAQGVRRDPQRVSRLAVLILVMHFLEWLWLVRPTFATDLSIHWMDVAAAIGLGGIWLALFFWQLKQRDLVPAPAVPILQERAHSAH